MEAFNQSNRKRKSVDIWSVQCGECFKWRLIPSEEAFEEIKCKFNEDPFFCSKIPGISCKVEAEIEMDNTRIWVIHKPNTPKTPPGFKRRVVIRKDFSKMDIYYDAPNGRKIRAKTEVPIFLNNYPQYKKDVSFNDFNFDRPKLMQDTLLDNQASKGNGKKRADNKGKEKVPIEGGIKKKTTKGKCFKCGLKGHWKATCTNPKKAGKQGPKQT